jgi:plastocyanin
MNTFIPKIKTTAILCAVSCVPLFAFAEEMANTGGANETKIEIKDFAFNPQTITVKSGDKITWINRDEEPHTVVSVEKRFKKSSALDTEQQFTITAGAPGTYTYYCSVHPKMTGTIIVKG